MRDDSLLVPSIAMFAFLGGGVAWPYVAIFVHELGHVVAGRLVGVTPTQVVIGYPDDGVPAFSFRVFGCAVDCWPLPFGGATFFSALPTCGLKLFIITIGGPLMDILVIFLCVLLWRNTAGSEARNAWLASAFFIRLGLFFIILAQSIDILCNLIPRSFRYDGVRVPNDAKIILRLFAGKASDLTKRRS